MMTRYPILAALALGLALAAWAGPGGGQEPKKAETQVGQSFRVPYRLTDTNHYLVRVRINGKGPFNFLVDSGAPALFIGTETAEAVGLEPVEDDFWTPVERLELEGGAVLTDLRARVEDPFQLVGMNALGLPGASIDGILGFTILARFRLTFDPTDSRMTWTRIDFTPREPFIPRRDRNRDGPARPAELQALELLGPLMQGMALFVGKQPEEQQLPRGSLGIVLAAPDEGDGKDSGPGVPVTEVLEGSPAARAGVRAGDRLVRLDGRAIADLDDIHAAAGEVQPGESLPLELRRDGETIRLTLTAGEGL